MDGIIIVNKPEDWTSFDVCAKIRGLSKTKKVGHSGTLDPFATGVLPVFLGTATKSVQQFLDGEKGYIAEMTLGVRTDTLDRTGKALTQTLHDNNPSAILPLPEGEGLRVRVEEVFAKYRGEIEQKPPMFSAKKINGQRLYKLAREGKEVERKACKVTIFDLQIEEILPPNKIRFKVVCSKGTYIRVLAAEMGDDLGLGAHLSELQRTYSHPFHISQALTIDTLVNLAKIGQLESVVMPVEDFIKK